MYTNALAEGQRLSRLRVILMLAGHNIVTRDQTVHPLDVALLCRLSDIVYDAWFEGTHSERPDVRCNRIFEEGSSG
jgi:hypothetical protein